MSTETTAKRDLQAEVAERFASDVAGHAMTVLHDDGLYRHLQFRQPDSAFGWFDLVTWPGSLVVRGDMGGHMFTRLDDMFQFFRSDRGSINPGYWAEKLSDYGDSARKYSEDLFASEIADRLAEYEQAYANGFTKEVTPLEARQMVEDADGDGLLGHEDGARELLRDLERAGVVSDTWEWDLHDWDFRYLWCCHAIVWGIRQYDAAKAVAR